jgi:tetratricopeptide (TPR) repeat protein
VSAAAFTIRRGAIPALALALMVLSCVTTPKNTDLRDADEAAEQARAHLARQDYKKALETLERAYREHPGNAALMAQYVRTAEQIKCAADASLEHRNYVEAAAVYQLLLRTAAENKEVSRSLTFDEEHLKARVRNCSKALTESGLVKYREGNIAQAIAIWKSILAFDPDNREVKNAIDTASEQLKTLKKIE